MSTGSGSFRGYCIEARVYHFVNHKPIAVNDHIYGHKILTEEWTTISFPEDILRRHVGYGLFDDKEKAMAKAWNIVAGFSSSAGVQARVVPVQVEYTHSRKAIEDECTFVGSHSLYTNEDGSPRVESEEI